jgi:hypothetical protein
MSSETDAKPSSAALSDPRALGLMTGFPPSAELAVTFADGSFRQFPKSRWAFSNWRQLLPTKRVWRGTAPASELPRDDRQLGNWPVALADGHRTTFDEAMEATYADGVAVLHRGRLVHERYWGVLEPHIPHIAMSVTKSFTGLLTGLMVAEGRIDPRAPVASYIAELNGSGFADARVEEVMDMTTGVDYSEVYADPKSDVHALRRASGSAPPEPGVAPTSLLEFLTTLKKKGNHGERFTYRTVNSEVLGWIVRRVSGRPFAELLSERIWQPIRAEEDAYISVDRLGMEYAGGGLNTTLRDLARVGELVRNRGRCNGQQILPERVVDDIAKGGDPAKFPATTFPTLAGWSYRNQWWVSHDPHGVYMARGIHGQSIYVDPAAEVVIARYASHPVAGNVANDPVTLPAFRAVALALMG